MIARQCQHVANGRPACKKIRRIRSNSGGLG